MPEVDSFYLPDVAATDYRQNHVKSSIVVEAIDLDAKVLRYFHNAGYFELSGDDYDGLFGPQALPPYVELVRFDAAPALSGDALRGGVARPARRRTSPSGRRTTRSCGSCAALEADLPRLLEGDEADYHAYAFHNPRMAGSSFELLASHVRWLLGEEGEKAAVALDDLVGGTKMLLFRLARRRAFDVAGVVGPMAEGWETGDGRARPSGSLTPMRRQVLEFERARPSPARTRTPSSTGGRRTVRRSTRPPAATLEIGGIATVWDVLVNGEVVASGRSMFERRSVDVSGALRRG